MEKDESKDLNCAPCAINYLDKLSEQWLDSNGEDLAAEGMIIHQCFKMDIDPDEHMKKLEEKLKKKNEE